MIDPRLAILESGLLALEQLLFLQCADHPDDRVGVVFRARQVFGAEAVRLELHLATVTGEDRLPGDVGQVPYGSLSREDRRGRAENAHARGLALLPDRVPRGHVPDFVAEHSSKFGF